MRTSSETRPKKNVKKNRESVRGEKSWRILKSERQMKMISKRELSEVAKIFGEVRGMGFLTEE